MHKTVKTNTIIGALLILFLLAPSAGLAKGGGGGKGGSFSTAAQNVSQAIVKTFTSSISSIKNAFRGGGATSTRELPPCDDPNGSGLRYCNFVFDVNQIGMTTYLYAENMPKPEGSGTIDLYVDIYGPIGDTEIDRPIVFFGHGGGGERTSNNVVNWCKEKFATRGWLCGAIDYRGASDVAGPFTAELQYIALSDMQGVVRWARASAEELGINPNEIILMGSSAGAITAIQASTMGNNLDAGILDDPKINTLYGSQPSWSCMAVTLAGSDNDKVKDYIDGNDPPASMYHGELDTKVLYSKAVETKNLMVAAGIPTTLMSFPNTAHSLEGHTDEIVTDLFPKLYQNVRVDECPPSYTNLVKIETGGGNGTGGSTSTGSTGDTGETTDSTSGGGGSGGGGSTGSSGGGSSGSSTDGGGEKIAGPVAGESGAMCANIGALITYGSTNDSEEVTKIQTFLNSHEHESLIVDGVFDREDMEAVKRFQEKYYSMILTPWKEKVGSGNVDWPTRDAINILSCGRQYFCPVFREYNSIKVNNNTPEVSRVKALLHDLGFYLGPIDNHFDQGLRSALKLFQETHAKVILSPWNFRNGTGEKGQTTTKYLNQIVGCETSAVNVLGKLFSY